MSFQQRNKLKKKYPQINCADPFSHGFPGAWELSKIRRLNVVGTGFSDLLYCYYEVARGRLRLPKLEFSTRLDETLRAWERDREHGRCAGSGL